MNRYNILQDFYHRAKTKLKKSVSLVVMNCTDIWLLLVNSYKSLHLELTEIA